MFRAIVTVVLFSSVTLRVLAADKDVDVELIQRRLEAAQEAFKKSIDRARSNLIVELKKKELAAQKVGDLKLLEKLQAETRSFEEKEETPKSVSLKVYEGQVRSARSKLEDAFELAVKQYTKAGKLELAKAVQQSLDEFKNERETKATSIQPATSTLAVPPLPSQPKVTVSAKQDSSPIALTPKQRELKAALDAVEREPGNNRLWAEVAHLQAQLLNFSAAAKSANEAWRLSPYDHNASFSSAAATLASSATGDGYRAICTKALRQFGDSFSMYACETTAKLCTFAPNAVDDYEPVLKLIDRAIELDTKREITAWTTLTKAEVLLRMKRFREARELTDECLSKHIEHQKERPFYETQVRLVRCLALRGMGEIERAKAEFERGEAIYSTHAPQGAERGNNWIDWTFCQRLRAEAQSEERSK